MREDDAFDPGEFLDPETRVVDIGRYRTRIVTAESGKEPLITSSRRRRSSLARRSPSARSARIGRNGNTGGA